MSGDDERQARHRRVAELFERACDLDPAAREAWLAEECDDPSIRAEVLRLLAHDAEPHPVLRAAEGSRASAIEQALRDAAGAAPPARVGPYRIEECIGEGGMGQVFAAEQLEPIRRRVALKFVKAGMDSAQVLRRFEAERQTLAIMSHPNIAQVFDGGVTAEGRPYFVMELVEGEPITAYCDRRGLSTRTRLELFLGVCEGVQHAHQKGVIHRDLKPSNLLVTEYDGRPVVKVIDFGVARATSGTLADRTLDTMVGQLVGTLDYMSPEQADPTHVDIDTRSDVYSLGVVLYELVSGLLPFEPAATTSAPLSERQREIREVEPPAPSTRLRRATDAKTSAAARRGTDERSLLRQLSGDLDGVVLKTLEKDPERRYSSPAALADDLRRYLKHRPVSAGRPGALHRLRKWTRRNRIGVAVGAVLVSAISFGVYGVVARSAEVLRLSDGYRLQQLETESATLWPPYPDRIPGLLALRDRAEDLLAKLDAHRATLTGRDWDPDSLEDAWQRQMLTDLLGGLETARAELLGGEAVGATFGWSVERRLRVARELEARFASGGDASRAWEEARPRLREAYPGLELVPQVGVLPLGPDPESPGFWAFAHLLSGEPAARDPETGRFVMADATGVVLLLVPGGTFWMGAQRDDPELPNYDPSLGGFDFDARSESPVHEATVEPFFVSKYEMTRAQWDRVMGTSWGSGRDPDGGSGATLPISNFTLRECEGALRWLGLAVPSEEEWEYAARAGTSTPWNTGADEASLEGAANLYDLALIERDAGFARMIWGEAVPWNDGTAGMDPVGARTPNAFGLYDTHGNVAEFCVAHRRGYRKERSPTPIPNLVFARGGSAQIGSFAARCSYRSMSQGDDFRHPFAGVRPVRRLDGR